MGSPKALIPFRGSTFLGCLLETIKQANEQAKKKIRRRQGNRVHARRPGRSYQGDQRENSAR
jgi:hypothetical protein